MLKRVDRIQLTTHNAQAVAERWMQLLDATAQGTDEVPQLNATRVTIQIGDSLVEILQPTGPGLVETHLVAGRGLVFGRLVRRRRPCRRGGRAAARGAFAARRTFSRSPDSGGEVRGGEVFPEGLHTLS